LLFETDKRFGEDQKTLDIRQYSHESSLVMYNYSFFHNSIRLPLVILNLRAFSSKSSYFIFNRLMSDKDLSFVRDTDKDLKAINGEKIDSSSSYFFVKQYLFLLFVHNRSNEDFLIEKESSAEENVIRISCCFGRQ
jgi:hypothetical protein